MSPPGFRDSPSPVSSSPDGNLRRLGEIVREAVRAIFSDRPFVQRSSTAQPLIAPKPDGSALKLEWGILNRVSLVASGAWDVQFPRIRSEWVGHPLYISQAVATGARMALVSGGPNLQGAAPLINGSATGIVATGMRTALTDGANWLVF